MGKVFLSQKRRFLKVTAPMDKTMANCVDPDSLRFKLLKTEHSGLTMVLNWENLLVGFSAAVMLDERRLAALNPYPVRFAGTYDFKGCRQLG